MNTSISKILNEASIPSPPSVAAQILDLVSRSDSTMDDLADIIKTDPKLAGKIIAYCNSPIVGSRREIGDLSQAVVILGMRTVRLISLSFSLLETQNDLGFDYQGFWRNSLATAIASQLCAEYSDASASEAFLQGLVLNVGAIGLANTYPNEYVELMSQLKAIDIDREVEVFRVHRYAVGAALLEKWCFPQHMIDQLGEFNPDNLTDTTRPFRLAQLLAELIINKDVLPQQIEDAKGRASEWFNIDSTGFGELYDKMLTYWSSYESLFKFESVPYASIEDLEAKAKEFLVATAMGIEIELQEANAEVEELEKDVIRDSLTQLKNRHAYDTEFEATFELHRRQDQSFGLLVIDIDHFKSMNDTHGHAAGDEVLKQVAATLKDKCRIYDTVYRYGGEEFVAVIANCDSEIVDKAAERFRAAIEELTIPFEEKVLNVTISIGACWAQPGAFESTDELFKLGDANLYQAKKTGRNRCVSRSVTSALNPTTTPDKTQSQTPNLV